MPSSSDLSTGATSPRSTIVFFVTTRTLVPPRALTSSARRAAAPKPMMNLVGDEELEAAPRLEGIGMPPSLTRCSPPLHSHSHCLPMRDSPPAV